MADIRFVDDIFCIWSGSDIELKHFSSDLQGYSENLKFDITDCGHWANYLDITVHLTHDDINDATEISERYSKTHG